MSITELLQFEFARNAILASVAASICCGVVGSLVVINRLSFLAGGVAHAAYGGVGLATFFKLPVLASTIVFSLFASMLMGYASIQNKTRSDATIGVIWAAGMALGILLIDLTPGYQGDLMAYLFGNILTVGRGELQMIALLVVLVLCVTYIFFKDFVALSFEEEYARTRGVSVDIIYHLLLALIAITVVISIQVVGLILVIALLTIPPQMAEHTARSLPGMMLRSTLWSLGFCLLGLVIAYMFEVTASACIIGIATLSFFANRMLRR